MKYTINEEELIIVNSAFHLLLAIGLKIQLLEKNKVDILILPPLSLSAFSKRLDFLFNKVHYLAEKQTVLRQKNGRLLIKYILKHFSFVIDTNKLSSCSTIRNSELSKYKKIYSFNTEILKKFTSSSLHRNVEFWGLDEGTAAYIASHVKLRTEVVCHTGILLYSPQYISNEYPLTTVKEIPKLPIENKNFLAIVNHVYRPPNVIHIKDNAIIFIDQPYPNNDVFVSVLQCLTLLKDQGETIYIKLHPRSEDRQREVYTKKGFDVETLEEWHNIPIEVFFICVSGKHLRLISVSSTALVSSILYFSSKTEVVKSYALFPIIAKRCAGMKEDLDMGDDIYKFFYKVAKENCSLEVLEDQKELCKIRDLSVEKNIKGTIFS